MTANVRGCRRLLLPAICVLAACTGFGTVRPDVFRSRQPGEDQLSRRIDAYELRSIVCLRGNGEGAAASARAAVGADIQFWHVPMSATRQPSPETLLSLWRVAAEAQRPLLLHCMAGADRTGLASAVIVLHDTGDLDAARGELSIWYGHLGMFGTQAMGEVLDRYEPHKAQMSFPDWVRDVYAAEFAAAHPDR